MIAALLLSISLASAPASWATHMEPAAAATVDVDAAVGAAYTPASSSPVPFSPALALGARWGVTDNVQLAFPLLLTGSFRVATIAGLPPLRLAVTGGLGGVGYSNVSGVILQPVLVASASSVGKRGAAVISADVGADTYDLDVVGTGAGVLAGFAFRLDDRWSVGVSGRLAMSRVELGDVEDNRYVVGVGSHGAGVPGDVPTLRFIVSDALSLELWSFLDVVLGSNAKAGAVVGAVAGATYHLGY